jgi:hypothetical protein
MDFRAVIVALAAAVLMGAPSAHAQNYLALGAVGVESARVGKLNKQQLVLRLDGDGLQLNRVDYSDVPESDKATQADPGVSAAWRPFRNAFMVTGGAALGKRKTTLRSASVSLTDIGGGAMFRPADAERRNGRVELGNSSPYLGVGYDNSFVADGHMGVRLVVGAAFGDGYRSLSAAGNALSSNSVLLAQIEAEERERQQDRSSFLKTRPIVSLGLNYRF